MKVKRKAFTLAETLITLVIVGVVAALTVPTMISKYQKEQTANKLKKEYSAFSQTIVRAITDYGNPNTWELADNDFSTEALLKFLNTYTTPYLNIMKKATIYDGNWDSKYYKPDKTEAHFEENAIRFYLSDGSSITARIDENTSTGKNIAIFIDINGDKKPNRLSRDIFLYDYYIRRTSIMSLHKLYPTYAVYSREEKINLCKTNGHGCAALIMLDGWKISDDYPW